MESEKMKRFFSKPIKGLMIDISGVLKNCDVPIIGSVEALRKLQDANFPFRLVTNETQATISGIIKILEKMNFNVKHTDVFSPIPAVIKILKSENLRPHLLIHPNVLSEFDEISVNEPNCVVIGDADLKFSYENMNNAFRALIEMNNPLLFTLGIGKYYKGDEGLTLDVGPFTKALEYAASVNARIVGKPDAEFFLTAVDDLNITPEETVMIGDDISFDIGGAQSCGIRGVLVRTGKFRTQDEIDHEVKPDLIVNDFSEVVDLILGNIS